ncbi:MAG: HigA family addiction module antitoxin [Chthoniobacterales bacterium]
MLMKLMKPIVITPGEILLEDYLKPMNITQEALAREIGTNVQTVRKIISGEQKISPEISLRLGLFFKQGPRFWYNVQTSCDFEKLKTEQKKIASKVRSNYEDFIGCLATV